jgi:hypothetical protein
MLVIAHHTIHDPDIFWAHAKELIPSLPSHIKIHGVYPSPDLRLCTCLWESPTVTDVQDFLDTSLGHVSKNFCYEVNETSAVGLPTKVLEGELSS